MKSSSIVLGNKAQQEALLAKLGFQLGELVSLRFDGSIGSIEGVEASDDGVTEMTLLVGMPVRDKEGTTQVRFPLAAIEKIIDLEELDAASVRFDPKSPSLSRLTLGRDSMTSITQLLVEGGTFGFGRPSQAQSRRVAGS